MLFRSTLCRATPVRGAWRLATFGPDADPRRLVAAVLDGVAQQVLEDLSQLIAVALGAREVLDGVLRVGLLEFESQIVTDVASSGTESPASTSASTGASTTSKMYSSASS